MEAEAKVTPLPANRLGRRTKEAAERRGEEVTLPSGLAPALDTKQAALYVGLALATLETMRNRGGGPRYLKYSRNKVAYRQHDLDEWMNARSVASTSEAA